MTGERISYPDKEESRQTGLRFFSPTGVVHITDDGGKRYFESRVKEIGDLGLARVVGIRSQTDFEPQEVGLVFVGSEFLFDTAASIHKNDNFFILEARLDPAPFAPIVCQLNLPGGSKLESKVNTEDGYGVTSEWQILGREDMGHYWFFVPADGQFLSKIRVSFH